MTESAAPTREPIGELGPSNGSPEATATLGEVFSNPNFVKFWIGQVTAYLGDRIDQIAMQTLVTAGIVAMATRQSWTDEATREAQGAAATNILACQILPQVLLTPFVGAIIDRLDRRRLLMAMDAWRGLLILCVALFLNREAHPNLIYGVVLLVGCGTAIFAPTKSAFMPEIVPSRMLLRANSVSSTMGSLMTAVGTPIGSWLIVHFSTPTDPTAGTQKTLMIDACGYLVSMIMLWWIIMPRRSVELDAAREQKLAEKRGPSAFFRDVKEGAQYIVRHRVPGTGVAIDAFFFFMAGLASAGINGLAFQLAPKVQAVAADGHALVGGDSAQATAIMAWLYGSLGGALFLGCVAAGRLGARARLGSVVAVSLGGTAAFLFLLGMVKMPLAATCIAVAGAAFFGGGSIVAVETALQQAVPDELRGRVFSLNSFLLNLSLIVAFVVSGLLTAGHYVSTYGILCLAAAVAACGALVGWIGFPRNVSIAVLQEKGTLAAG